MSPRLLGNLDITSTDSFNAEDSMSFWVRNAWYMDAKLLERLVTDKIILGTVYIVTAQWYPPGFRSKVFGVAKMSSNLEQLAFRISLTWNAWAGLRPLKIGMILQEDSISFCRRTAFSKDVGCCDKFFRHLLVVVFHNIVI
jgi:hypothetical protein